MPKLREILLSIVILAAAPGGFFLHKYLSVEPDPVPSIHLAIKDDEILASLTKRVGIKETMVKLVTESKSGLAFDCHQPAHKIGRIGYDLHKEKAFAECSASCHSGCYHGAMEGFLIEKGLGNLSQDIDLVCNAFETNFGKFECLHGVGHGVLAFLNYDLPAALKKCEELSGFFAQSSCYGGAFMENIITAQGFGAAEGAHSTKWVSADPLFPCNAIGDDYAMRYQCYQMQTSQILYNNGNNFEKTANECLKVPEDMKAVCFKSLGRDAAGQTVRDPQRMLQLCSYAKNNIEYYKQCISGGMNVIVDFWGPDLKGQASEFCHILPEKNLKTGCFQELADRIKNLFPTKDLEQTACATFDDYRYLCEVKSS